MGLIQTPDQLRFSYLAIIEGAKRLHPDNAVSFNMWPSNILYIILQLYKDTLESR